MSVMLKHWCLVSLCLIALPYCSYADSIQLTITSTLNLGSTVVGIRINDSGTIAFDTVSNGVETPNLREIDGTVIQLAPLGSSGTGVEDINDSNEIVGYYRAPGPDCPIPTGML